MSEEEYVESGHAEFNAGVATAMTVRELCNLAALARMQRNIIGDSDRLGYLDFIDSLYGELINFMTEKDDKLDEYAEFYRIKIKAEKQDDISFEDFQKVRHFEIVLRKVAKPILMPGKKDPRFGGYG